nr:unnamed protein product [Spirometra erinaceieuropaei]
MVPIVYGASREEFYQRAPPNPYIHVDDFENVEQLAKYLQYVDKNDTAYATYFAWNEHGEILNPRDNASLPLIFYDKRLLYHDVFTEGCQYKCQYTSDIRDIQRAHLAVFTQNPPRLAYRYSRRQIWALETGEPVHLIPLITDQAKDKFTMYITHHTFATVPFYYGVYWAFKKPDCSMPKAERLKLWSQNSLRFLPKQHAGRSKMVAWVVSNDKAPNMRNKLANAIAEHVPASRIKLIAVARKPSAALVFLLAEFTRHMRFTIGPANLLEWNSGMLSGG